MRAWDVVLLTLLAAACTDGPVVSPPDVDDDDTVDTVDTTDTDFGEIPVVPGNLVITEVMVNPIGCAQYVELYNTTGRTLDLTAFRLSNGVDEVAILDGALEGSRYLVGVVGGGDPCGATAAFTLEPITFSYADGAKVSLIDGEGVVIDEVTIAGWEDLPGASWALKPAGNALENNLKTNWCQSISPAGPSLGTPGRVNDACTPGTKPRLPPLPLAEAAPDALVISEILFDVDRCDGVGQAVEITNVSDRGIILDGLRLTDGTDVVDLPLVGTLAGGTAAFIAAGSASSSCFADLYDPWAWWGDVLTLEDGETLHIGRGAPFEELDAVATGSWLLTEGVSMQLSSDRMTVSANDRPQSWCPSRTPISQSTSYGTFGLVNPLCLAGQTAPARMGDDLEVGDLIITEVMFNPGECVDYKGQYFEAYNASGRELDLQGLTIVVDGRSVTLQGNYPIVRGQHAVAWFANRGQPPSCYAGLPQDFFWDTDPFDIRGGRITLLSGATTIDTINLGGLAPAEGYAMQLDPRRRDVNLNDDGTYWCPSTANPPGLLGDFGSPGADNHICEAPIEPEDTGDTDVVVVPDPPTAVGALNPGDLVITELMPDPTDCADFAAEYLEVYNATDATIDLTGLRVGIGGASDTVFDAGTVAPGAFFTLRYSTGSPPSCYGFVGAALYSTNKMNDLGVSVSVRNALGVIDEVPASGWGLIGPGVGLTLDPDHLDATANDDPARWCVPTTPIAGGADVGSPGRVNADCPGVP